MKMKWGKLSGILLAAGVLLAGCVGGAEVYSDNEAIARDYDHSTAVLCLTNHDKNSATMTASSFEGMKNLWSYQAQEEEEITLTIQLHVEAGKAKVVLVTPDKEVKVLAEHDAAAENQDTPETVQAAVRKGKNRIRVVAEKGTKLDLSVELQGKDAS